MGLCYYDIALIFSFEKIFPEKAEISMICEIIKENEVQDYYDKYIVKVKQVDTIIKKKTELKKYENTKLILYLKNDTAYFPGDILYVKGKFEKGEIARNYKGFDYRNYLKQNKIYGIVFADRTEKINQRKDIYFVLAKIRNIIEKQIDKLYANKFNVSRNDYSNFLKGILVGSKSELNKEIIENFQNANISHILAISGMHISFIVVGVNFLLEKIINSKKIRNILLIFFIIFFLLLTGNSVSCMRACIMNIFMILADCFYRKNNFLVSFVVSLILIIIINPYNIFNVGMWLSYLGTLGIVIIHNFLYKVLCKKLKLKEKNKISKFILKSFCLSVSAQILIFPIIIYVFNNFSLTFFISNIIVSVFINYILFLGYVSILVSFVFFPLSKFISHIEKIMIWIIFEISHIIGDLPFSKIILTTSNFLEIVIYYLTLFAIVLYIKNNTYFVLRNIFSKNILRKIISYRRNIKRFIVIYIIILVVINSNKFDFELKIYFVDVGQGDCTFIITPYGKRILIDGGEGNTDKYDYGEKVLFPYLLDRGTNKIDYLVASHADSDHMGGLIYILENMKVKNILIGTQPESSKQLEKLIEIANNKKVKITILEKGNIVKVDKNVDIEVLWPDRNNLISENTLNNNSLVFKLVYNNFSMIFTGDIEEVAENMLISTYSENLSKLKSTILKVPHHGSKSSSTQEFLNIVSPKVALIGVGKNNNFGHPNEDIIKRIEKFGIKIYRTDQMGEISIVITRKGKISVKKFIEEK